MAASLVPALAAAGHNTMQVSGRAPEGIPAETDVCILAVKDDAIGSVARRIAEECPAYISRMIMVHTAGSVHMDILQGSAARYGVVYPMQTFTQARPVSFADIPCFVEASDSDTLCTLMALARSISGNVSELSSDRRRYLHLAAVFACNFVNHCYDLAATLLEPAGLPFSTLLPLIDETARKVHTLHPHEAQTGPAVRYDSGVMARHEQLLRQVGGPADVYALMSKSIHDKL